MEVAVITAILLHPVMGMVRLWAAKTLGASPPGSVSHGVAEVVAVFA